MYDSTSSDGTLNLAKPKASSSAKKSSNKVRVDDVAKASTDRLCNCPGSEPGKVKIDIDEHLLGCRYRKRSFRYTSKTLAIPNKILDGCSWGVVLREATA